MSLAELKAMRQSVLLTDDLYNRLEAIINEYYVDELSFEYFLDKEFLAQTKMALTKIAESLSVGPLYDFEI
jgi:succinylarginine dihydrolase